MWENGKKGERFTPYISLKVFNTDNLGHIAIEVYMEIHDGAPIEKHNCCFYIKTEIGIIEKFARKIIQINEKAIGKKFQLIDLE